MFEETLENVSYLVFMDIFFILSYILCCLQNYIEWGKNLNAARFVDDERQTLNFEGRAQRDTVWNLYREVCMFLLLF